MKAESFGLVTKCLVPVSDVLALPQNTAVCRWGKNWHTSKSLLGSSLVNCATKLQSQLSPKRKITTLCNLPVHLHDKTGQQRHQWSGTHQCPACRSPAICAESLRGQVRFCALFAAQRRNTSMYMRAQTSCHALWPFWLCLHVQRTERLVPVWLWGSWKEVSVNDKVKKRKERKKWQAFEAIGCLW